MKKKCYTNYFTLLAVCILAGCLIVGKLFDENESEKMIRQCQKVLHEIDFQGRLEFDMAEVKNEEVAYGMDELSSFTWLGTYEPQTADRLITIGSITSACASTSSGYIEFACNLKSNRIIGYRVFRTNTEESPFQITLE